MAVTLGMAIWLATWLAVSLVASPAAEASWRPGGAAAPVPPTCVGPDKPPKYPTTYYTDYMVQYQKRTYDLLADDNRQAAE